MAEAKSDGQASNASNQSPYNKVFENFVDEIKAGIDLPGLIAYGLYKKQKREWLITWKDAHDGQPPSSSQIDAMTSSFLTNEARETLKERAADLLNSYAEDFAEARTPDIQNAALSNETLRQAREIETSVKRKSSFWFAVGAGVTASLVWTLILAALVVAIGPEILSALAQSLRSP